MNFRAKLTDGRMVHTALRRGHYADVLRHANADMLFADVPYSSRTHSGHDATSDLGRRPLPYKPWSSSDFRELARWSEHRIYGWINLMVDHTQVADAEAAIQSTGRYTFAPLPVIHPGMTCRFQGDGPSCECVFMVVGRPRSRPWSSWGTLPGYYIRQAGYLDSEHPGGKPLGTMMRIIGDYTRPGHTVIDPCAGNGTTIVAAEMIGRTGLGAEIDPGTHARALASIANLSARGRTSKTIQQLAVDIEKRDRERR